jgi:hypothetical protein
MTQVAEPSMLAGLAVVRDGSGRAAALEGDGVRHRRRDLEGGWTVVDDPAGATALRQDEDRTELLRDGQLMAQRRLRDAEEWTVPGTPGCLRIERDPDGEVSAVLAGGQVVARRADGEKSGRRAGGGDVGTARRPVRRRSCRYRREWAARRGNGTLTRPRQLPVRRRGWVVEHRHLETGSTCHTAGRDTAVDTPAGRVDRCTAPTTVLEGTTTGRTTYGYDEGGRRVRRVAARSPAPEWTRSTACRRDRRRGMAGAVRV